MNIINSIVKLKNRIIYNKFSKFAHPQKFKWQWDEKLFNRIALINFLVSKTGGWECAYLEIGCNKDTLFNFVAVQDAFLELLNRRGLNLTFGVR